MRLSEILTSTSRNIRIAADQANIIDDKSRLQ